MILKDDIPKAMPQFITRGSSINPYCDNIFCKTKGSNFTPTTTPNSAPTPERMKIPDVMDLLILLEVIPIDL